MAVKPQGRFSIATCNRATANFQPRELWQKNIQYGYSRNNQIGEKKDASPEKGATHSRKFAFMLEKQITCGFSITLTCMCSPPVPSFHPIAITAATEEGCYDATRVYTIHIQLS